MDTGGQLYHLTSHFQDVPDMQQLLARHYYRRLPYDILRWHGVFPPPVSERIEAAHEEFCQSRGQAM
jgi:hypothetical protein